MEQKKVVFITSEGKPVTFALWRQKSWGPIPVGKGNRFSPSQRIAHNKRKIGELETRKGKTDDPEEKKKIDASIAERKERMGNLEKKAKPEKKPETKEGTKPKVEKKSPDSLKKEWERKQEEFSKEERSGASDAASKKITEIQRKIPRGKSEKDLSPEDKKEIDNARKVIYDHSARVEQKRAEMDKAQANYERATYLDADITKGGYNAVLGDYGRAAWGREHYGSMQFDTKSRQETLHMSKDITVNNLNAMLRNDQKPSAGSKESKYRRGMTQMLKETSTPENLVVFRGFTSETIEKNLNTIKGTKFSDKGFVCTSLNPKVGEHFASEYAPGGRTPIVARIRIPKGSQAMYLDSNAHVVSDLTELVLPTNSNFNILNGKKKGNVIHLDMELSQ